jgi:hypothetical protein
MQQVFLPFAVEGGGFMVLRCILRAAYTACLLDTAESRSMLPGSPSAASLLEPSLPAYATYLQELWPGRCAGPATCGPPHQSRQTPINNKPGGEQGSWGAVLAVARFWESGARMAEVERGRVRRRRDTTWGLLPEAVVGLPGRAYCFTRGRHNVGDDQLNTVSCGGGKPMLEAGKKTTLKPGDY